MRIYVIGVTGSGKTTLARQLAHHLGCPQVELDALVWGPQWQLAPDALFLERLTAALVGDDWVVDGNYSRVRDLIWARVELVVWLDYPLVMNLWRLLRRSIRRIVSQEELWGTGNRETWRSQFLQSDSLFVWAITTHGEKRRRYSELIQRPEYAHIHFVRLRSPRATQRWLAAFKQQT